MWKSKMAGGGGNKKIFQYCTDPSGQEILYLRALQGHSGRNPIDRTLHDHVLIPNNFFEYTCQIGCAISLHSITNSGLIAKKTKFKQGRDRRYSLQPWIPWIKSTEIRKSLIWPNHVLHRTNRSGKDTRTRCIGSKKPLSQRKGLTFHQTRCNAIILYDTLPACCISKVVVMESQEIIHQKVYVSPRSKLLFISRSLLISPLLLMVVLPAPASLETCPCCSTCARTDWVTDLPTWFHERIFHLLSLVGCALVLLGTKSCCGRTKLLDRVIHQLFADVQGLVLVLSSFPFHCGPDCRSPFETLQFVHRLAEVWFSVFSVSTSFELQDSSLRTGLAASILLLRFVTSLQGECCLRIPHST